MHEVRNTAMSFSAMVKLLRRLWVLDMGSVFEVMMEDDETIPSCLLLKTGVWAENRAVLEALKTNDSWWGAHFSEKQADGIHVFKG